jgi:small-conductance mechanosensitive channel
VVPILQGNMTELSAIEVGAELAVLFVIATFIALLATALLERRMKRREYAQDSRRLVNRVAVILIYLVAIALAFEMVGIGLRYFLFESPYSKPAQFGLVVFSATIIAKLITAGLEHSARRIGVDESVRRTANQVITIIIYLIALVISFILFDVKLGGLLTAGGLVTAAIVFATGQIINNLVSGLLIVTGRSFEVGDVIQIGADRGRVEKLSIRTTTILTEDGRNMVVPNMQFVTTPVINYTKVAHPDIRVTVNFNVKRGSKDLTEVRRIIADALDRHFVYPDVSDPALHLRSVTAAMYSFTAYIWVTEPSKIDRITDEALDRIKAALDEAGVEFA